MLIIITAVAAPSPGFHPLHLHLGGSSKNSLLFVIAVALSFNYQRKHSHTLRVCNLQSSKPLHHPQRLSSFECRGGRSCRTKPKQKRPLPPLLHRMQPFKGRKDGEHWNTEQCCCRCCIFPLHKVTRIGPRNDRVIGVLPQPATSCITATGARLKINGLSDCSPAETQRTCMAKVEDA